MHEEEGVYEEPREDYAEYVDEDEHEEAEAYEGPQSEREEHEEDIYDEYHYGEESGEAYRDEA